MFIVCCSHKLPATAELPFANRPGDRTDRFRSTCRSSLFVIIIYSFLLLWRFILFGQIWPQIWTLPLSWSISFNFNTYKNRDLDLFKISDQYFDRLLTWVWSPTTQFTAYQAYCFTTHTPTHTNMLTCSSVTRKTATGCGLGTKTFSELSEDAGSQDAPSQNVKNFRCQNRQAQALIWGEMMLKQLQRCTYTLQRCFVGLWQLSKVSELLL